MFNNIQNQVPTIDVIVEDGISYEVVTTPTNKIGEIAQERKVVNKAYYQKVIDTMTARIAKMQEFKDKCAE